MENHLLTLATFPNPESAGFVRGLLEGEGIRAYLADETATGMLWHLSNSIGWVKLQVAEADMPRAQEILDAQRQTLADLGPEAFAAAAAGGDSADEFAATTADASAADEPDGELADPVDDLASRAFRASAIGLIFCPLLLYAAWLIGRLIFSRAELSPRASRKLWLAFGLTTLGILGYYVLLHGPF
jgi:hypothetical protein